MHISEIQLPQNIILTKCSKMTEEGHRLEGMNGNADRNIKEECQKTNYGQGGRLKFFKDGKFILELERAREGERVSWVSVPRKTFWPPQGTASSMPSYRQESSTSLSVSDDNSSIQSSPWQRDHSWKQTTPCRNISKELIFYFWRPKDKRLVKKSRKRRAPYSLTPDSESGNTLSVIEDRTVIKNKKTRTRSLFFVIQSLSEKNSRTSTPPRAETVVSPRKRFLREMEKDKVQIEDSNCQKRSRSKQQAGQSALSVSKSDYPALPPKTDEVGLKTELPIAANGVEETKPARNCSYSITSLLAEDRNSKRSPSSSPSHYSPAQPRYCSPPTEEHWYSESVDRLRSIELSQVEKCGGYPHFPPQSLIGPYMYPFPPVPPYYGAGLYGRGYVMPSMYHTPPIQLPIRHETPSCSWTAEPARESDRRDEPTDMPLNLSKHSG